MQSCSGNFDSQSIFADGNEVTEAMGAPRKLHTRQTYRVQRRERTAEDRRCKFRRRTREKDKNKVRSDAEKDLSNGSLFCGAT